MAFGMRVAWQHNDDNISLIKASALGHTICVQLMMIQYHLSMICNNQNMLHEQDLSIHKIRT